MHSGLECSWGWWGFDNLCGIGLQVILEGALVDFIPGGLAGPPGELEGSP